MKKNLTVKEGNGETQSSSEASSEASAATAGIEEVDGNTPDKQELSWRNRAHTSPDTLNRFKVNRPPKAEHRVRFSQYVERGNSW